MKIKLREKVLSFNVAQFETTVLTNNDLNCTYANNNSTMISNNMNNKNASDNNNNSNHSDMRDYNSKSTNDDSNQNGFNSTNNNSNEELSKTIKRKNLDAMPALTQIVKASSNANEKRHKNSKTTNDNLINKIIMSKDAQCNSISNKDAQWIKANVSYDDSRLLNLPFDVYKRIITADDYLVPDEFKRYQLIVAYLNNHKTSLTDFEISKLIRPQHFSLEQRQSILLERPNIRLPNPYDFECPSEFLNPVDEANAKGLEIVDFKGYYRFSENIDKPVAGGFKNGIVSTPVSFADNIWCFTLWTSYDSANISLQRIRGKYGNSN